MSNREPAETKKLTLSRHTLRRLTSADLLGVKGASGLADPSRRPETSSDRSANAQASCFDCTDPLPGESISVHVSVLEI
jgi:hypothetical protein